MTADGVEESTGGPNGDGASDRAAGAPRCPHCDAAMYKRHCKYVCPQHGVIIDCSDPFR
ncbi:HVO_2523 family zinc finger protein [Natrinema salinisoli]|uniref:HVO_2523 family zinc finger protein n=1 Tax=Natrinema salinisoli TaxID=2878535 RepID=UPI001CEFD5DC|nr:HVO_2523 family zinc finger protein [Natrinema salinisoli]